MAYITADFDSRHRDKAKARITHFSRNQHGQFALHLVTDTLGTAEYFGHKSASSCKLQAASCKLQAVK
jgi:hypothetical protein